MPRSRLRHVCLLAVLAACGGDDGGGPIDAPLGDDAADLDAAVRDAAELDAPNRDAAAPDGIAIDATALDAIAIDAAATDAAAIDAAAIDAVAIDAATAPPCTNGPGRVLWRLSWPAGQGGYARVDAWAAACAYSLADAACSLSGEPHTYASFGPGIVFNSTTDYFRVRFSVAGLSFTTATLYLAAHADGSGLPRLQVQSQLHGEYLFQPTVPISTHRLYAIDWTAYLAPTDTPSLTAVTLRPMPTGVAVSDLELCVQ